jgi:hypothetical protein
MLNPILLLAQDSPKISVDGVSMNTIYILIGVALLVISVLIVVLINKASKNNEDISYVIQEGAERHSMFFTEILLVFVNLAETAVAGYLAIAAEKPVIIVVALHFLLSAYSIFSSIRAFKNFFDVLAWNKKLKLLRQGDEIAIEAVRRIYNWYYVKDKEKNLKIPLAASEVLKKAKEISNAERWATVISAIGFLLVPFAVTGLIMHSGKALGEFLYFITSFDFKIWDHKEPILVQSLVIVSIHIVSMVLIGVHHLHNNASKLDPFEGLMLQIEEEQASKPNPNPKKDDKKEDKDKKDEKKDDKKDDKKDSGKDRFDKKDEKVKSVWMKKLNKDFGASAQKFANSIQGSDASNIRKAFPFGYKAGQPTNIPIESLKDRVFLEDYLERTKEDLLTFENEQVFHPTGNADSRKKVYENIITIIGDRELDQEDGKNGATISEIVEKIKTTIFIKIFEDWVDEYKQNQIDNDD